MKTRSPSICYIVNSLNQKDPLYDLVPALQEHTNINDIGIIAWFNYNDDIELFEEYADVTHINANRDLFGMSINNYKEAINVLKEYDIVQSNTTPAELHAKLLGSICRKPIVHREGNVLYSYRSSIRMSRFLTNILTNKIVCVSDPVRDSFGLIENFFLQEKKKVIHNGVGLDFKGKSTNTSYRGLLNIPSNEILISTAASLKPQKAHGVLLQAVHRANKISDKKIHLAIAGEGELRGELEEKIQRLNLEDRVFLLGLLSRDDLHSLLCESDIFVMPSRHEGFCVAVLQAMARKKPCILTNIEPFRCYFEDSALFVPVDDINKLSEKIAYLSNNHGKRELYGELGYRTVTENYSRRQMAKKYEETYLEMI